LTAAAAAAAPVGAYDAPDVADAAEVERSSATDVTLSLDGATPASVFATTFTGSLVLETKHAQN